MNIQIKTASFAEWKKVIRTFVHPGDLFEIRCWEGENLDFAQKWGTLSASEGVETVYGGKATMPFLKELCAQQGENGKATSLFTLSFTCSGTLIYSEKYGTELHILNADEGDIKHLETCGIIDYIFY